MSKNVSYKPEKKEALQELVRCGKSPSYFINNYCRISHPQKGIIPFKTFKYQDELLKDFVNFRFNVILKARQLGITTLTSAYVLWYIIFHRAKSVVVLSTKQEKSAAIIKRCKQIYKYLPDFLKITKQTADNKLSIEFDNGSIAKAEANAVDAGRSESLSLLVVDEAAHVSHLDTLWASIKPTLATGGSCIIASTPNGAGNFFHQTYVDSETGLNDFHHTKLMWWEHPERDEAWFLKETRNMSRRQIKQEYECDFLLSGETVFNPEDIEKLKEQIKEPVERTGIDRNLWIWEHCRDGCTYSLTADVSRGDGTDFSVFHVLKLETMEIVAEYQGKMTPDIFARLVYDVGIQYNNCMIIAENNSIGFAVLEKLEEWNYPNIYYSAKGSHEYVEQYIAESKSNVVAGFTTSMKTRPLIVAKLEEYIRNKMVKINSIRIVTEMTTFVWSNGRPEHLRGYNDDLIMALAIAVWVKDTALTVNSRELEYKKVFMDNMIRVSRPLVNVYNETTEQKRKEYLKQIQPYAWIYKG